MFSPIYIIFVCAMCTRDKREAMAGTQMSEITCRNKSFPFTLWVLGIELRSWDLEASTFTHWAILSGSKKDDVYSHISHIFDVYSHNGRQKTKREWTHSMPFFYMVSIFIRFIYYMFLCSHGLFIETYKVLWTSICIDCSLLLFPLSRLVHLYFIRILASTSMPCNCIRSKVHESEET